MVVLTGSKLGERQKQLNLKVREVVQEDTKLEDIKEEDGIDVNTLIKIDVAAHYRDADYVLSTLKSGDSLFISKIIKKCSFLYEDEYSSFVNPNYLHQNIFPMMSSKMKTKLLTEISKRNLNEERSGLFFEYCISDKNNNCAFKFLRNTSISFKKELILRNESIVSLMINNSDMNMKSFVKESFELASMILEHINTHTAFSTLLQLTYLFPSCHDSYLNLVEKFITVRYNAYKLMSRDISDTILKKHKSRVLNKPVLYVHILNRKSIARFTTAGEAKFYLENILPDTSQDFFRTNFCRSYDFLIDLLKPEEKFSDLKEIFNKKYPGRPFEMSEEFYNKRCYEFMTQAEREVWALRHLESGDEILRPNEGYIWCKFIRFEKALPIIKNFVLKTPLRETRTDILVTLIYSARNQQEVEQLLNYYYERHVNEKANLKDYFLRTIHNHWNVFTFETDCWTAYNKILSSLDIYQSSTNSYSYTLEQLVAVSLFYHISHKLNLPDTLIVKLKNVFIDSFYRPYFSLLNEDQRNVVLQFLLQFYLNQINDFAYKSDNFSTITKENMYSVENLCSNVLNLLQMYKKQKDNIPEIVMKFFDHYPTAFKNSSFYKRESRPQCVLNLSKKILKGNATFIIHSFNELKGELANNRNIQNTRSFVRALQIYFAYDIAKDFAKLLLDSFQNADTNVSESFLNTAVFILLQVFDNEQKIEFMLKHAPKDPKIKHDQKDVKLIGIQKAICKFSCFSRPPLPNKYITKYIIGDYLQYSYHVFWVNLSRLPRPQLIEFIESQLDTPISIQKQAINIAFKCFDVEDLGRIVSRAWAKSKNVSLRMVLYSNTLSKMVNIEEDAQEKLFEIIINFTENLTESDCNIYDLILSNNIPLRFRGRYLETAWDSLNKIPTNKLTKLIAIKLIKSMVSSISLMNREFIDNFIKKRIALLSFDEEVKEIDLETESLEDAKWSLVTTYINHYKDDKSMDYTKMILIKCIKESDYKVAAVRKFVIDKVVSKIKYSSSEIIHLIIKKIEENVELPLRYNLVFTLKCADAVVKALNITANSNQGDGSNHKEVFNALSLYTRNLVEVIKDEVAKNMFYRSFCKEIAEIVKDNINYIAAKLAFNDNRTLLYNYLASKLTEAKFFETNMLAIYIISTSYSSNCNELRLNVVQNILDFDDGELSFLLYNLVERSQDNVDIAKRIRLH